MIWRKYLFLLLIGINFLLLFALMQQKQVIHVDEIFSFAHANSSTYPFLVQGIDSYFTHINDKIYNRWWNGKLFHDYLTVQPDEMFQYDFIWKNMGDDVHPPLYFVLLHTLCSFFPDSFSLWYGFGLNLLIWGCLLLALYRLAKLFLPSELLGQATVLLFAFSLCGLSSVVFIRMYLLQTLLAVLLMYYTCKMIQNNMASYGDLAKICIFSFLGIFTHYSSIVFSFILAACSCSLLLWRKNYALLWRYALMMLCSVAMLFLFFPDAWYALFFSYRGMQAQKFGGIFFSDYVLIKLDLLIYRFIDVWGTKLLSFSEVNMTVIFIGLCLLVACFWWAKEKFQTIFYVLLFSVLFFGLYVVLLMPAMGPFDLRYFFLITPFMAIISVCVIYKLGLVFLLPKKVFYSLLAILLVLNSFYAKPFQKGVFNVAYTQSESNALKQLQGKKIAVLGIKEKLLTFRFLPFIYQVNKIYFTEKYCSTDVWKNVDLVFVYYYTVENSGPRGNVDKLPLCKDQEHHLRFISEVNIGWTYLDLYEVIKN